MVDVRKGDGRLRRVRGNNDAHFFRRIAVAEPTVTAIIHVVILNIPPETIRASVVGGGVRMFFFRLSDGVYIVDGVRCGTVLGWWDES